MNIPNKLPIVRIEDYHTHYLGKTPDGNLFWGYETFVFEKPLSELKDDDWTKYRREYAILHTFDEEGNHLTSKTWSGYTFDSTHLISEKLEEFVTALGAVSYQDIEVKLFQISIDGLIFALVPNYEIGSIDLQPGSLISFQEPWDGEYFT